MTTFKLTISAFFIGLTVFVFTNTKPEYTTISKAKTTIVDDYTLMKTKCLICHQSSVEHDKRIAPPMFAVKRRYSNQVENKEQFVKLITKWVLNPNKENAIMHGAVNKFNVMPNLQYKKEDVEKIAAYLYDHDVEKPNCGN